jgi:hypothetical protein
MEGPRFAYSPEQRADWLDECHANFDRLNDEDQFDGRRHGARVGGLLGAIGGGIAGNRIAGRGNRVVETAIGAGVGAGAGALAGAAIGSAADADSDRRGPPHGDYCEDYLSRYESGAANYGQGGGYGYGPVMWVRVPIIRERSHDCDCEEVIEEVVYTPHHARRVTPRRAVVRKYVRYAK